MSQTAITPAQIKAQKVLLDGEMEYHSLGVAEGIGLSGGARVSCPDADIAQELFRMMKDKLDSLPEEKRPNVNDENFNQRDNMVYAPAQLFEITKTEVIGEAKGK